MSAPGAEPSAAGSTIPRQPNGSIFHSEWGVFPFQADDIAQSYLRLEPGAQGGVVPVWDMGIGKTVLTIATGSYLYEAGKIDLIMVIAERSKLIDWREDFKKFTKVNAHVYYGQGRQKRLAKALAAGPVHVIITSYETGRNELVQRKAGASSRSNGARQDGPLVATLGLRGKRVLWAFDECTKLRGRSSQTHQAYHYILRQLKKTAHQRVLGLTGTPMERDYEDAYNIGRIVCPDLMPTVAEFEERFTCGVDAYGRYYYKRDREKEFADLFQQIILRRRKTDPDVAAQFPEQVEKFNYIDLRPEHAKFYRTVESIFDVPAGQIDTRDEYQIELDERRLRIALRMTAGNPASHLYSDSMISRAIRDAVGEDTLRAIPNSKLDWLRERLKEIVAGQGDQAIVFTFFAKTILPDIVAALNKDGYVVGEFHGGQTASVNEHMKNQFVRGGSQILVCSDAAARGLNLGNAPYLFEYECANDHATRVQRMNRNNRINTEHKLVTCSTMIARNTVEESVLASTLRKNARQDLLLGDSEDGSDFVSARQRRKMLQG